MDFDPNEAPQYLEGLEYPAGNGDLAPAAEDNGAPEQPPQGRGTLGWPTLEGVDEVVADPEASLTSG